MKITFETKAWMSSHNTYTPDQLRTPDGVASLNYTHLDMGTFGDALVGTATITVELVDDRVMIDNKIDSLREQAASIRAEATAKCTKIESQIQQLLCIENSAVAT